MLRNSVAGSGLQGTKGRAKDISEKALVKDSGPNRVVAAEEEKWTHL